MTIDERTEKLVANQERMQAIQKRLQASQEKTQALLASSGIPCIEKPFRVQQLISVVENTFGKP